MIDLQPLQECTPFYDPEEFLMYELHEPKLSAKAAVP